MFVAFALEAVSIFLLSQFGSNPLAFVVLTAMVFFAYGEIYSLFPAACADSYGKKFASANAGLLYTAKGTASLLVPLSSLIAAQSSWRPVFLAAAAMNLVAAFVALMLLKPLRSRLVGGGVGGGARA
jgi:OFA family oxalate/formate antiporter-like MFS transporter